MLPETKKAGPGSYWGVEDCEGRSTEAQKPVVPRGPSGAFANSKATAEKLNRKQVEKLSRVQQIFEDGAQNTDFRVTAEEGPC